VHGHSKLDISTRPLTIKHFFVLDFVREVKTLDSRLSCIVLMNLLRSHICFQLLAIHTDQFVDYVALVATKTKVMAHLSLHFFLTLSAHKYVTPIFLRIISVQC